MSRGRDRKGPSDPQEIMARREAQRLADKGRPENWGVSAQILYLPTARDVELVIEAGRVQSARRLKSDPFDLLHAREALTDGQHRAARRLYRDWEMRAGVCDADRAELAEKIDGGGRGDGVAQFQIDAGKRIAKALEKVGPVNSALLSALVGRFAEGIAGPWRAIVQAVTAEADRNSQGALVRQACESLRLVYELQDDDARRRAEAAKPKAVRPFGSFEADPQET